MMDLQGAALATDGTAVGGNVSFMSVSTDSRAIQPGQLFIALRGDRFDGHEFLAAVAAQGAAAAMVDRAWAAANPVPLPLLVVDDTRLGLGRLAASWRAGFELPLIGVTGSNGKTSVKEMCAAILRAQARIDGFDPELAVLATKGNLNNDIGLPLMLLRLSGNHRSAVIEMGMNHPGEIGYLTQLARPTVALVNNAQRAHLQGMGSVNEVAREKGAIYEGPVGRRRGGGQCRRCLCRLLEGPQRRPSHAHVWSVGRRRGDGQMHRPRVRQRHRARLAPGRSEVPPQRARQAQRAQRAGGCRSLSGCRRLAGRGGRRAGRLFRYAGPPAPAQGPRRCGGDRR